MTEDQSPDSYVSVSVAGKITAIPVRTIHYWVTTGKVRTVAGGPNARGKLVRLGDVQKIALLTGRAARHASATQTQAHTVQYVADSASGDEGDQGKHYAVQMRNAASNAITHLEQVYQQQLRTRDESMAAERAAYADALKSKDETIAELRRRAEVAETHAAAAHAPVPLWRRLFRRPQL